MEKACFAHLKTTNYVSKYFTRKKIVSSNTNIFIWQEMLWAHSCSRNTEMESEWSEKTNAKKATYTHNLKRAPLFTYTTCLVVLADIISNINMSVCGCLGSLMCSFDGDTAIDYCRPLQPFPWYTQFAIEKQSKMRKEVAIRSGIHGNKTHRTRPDMPLHVFNIHILIEQCSMTATSIIISHTHTQTQTNS